MKRLLFLLGILLVTSPTWATLAVVQHVVNSACSTGTTCVLTVTSTGSGHILVVGAASQVNPTRTITLISAGGTFSHCANTPGSNSGGGNSTDAQYTLNSASGVTVITVTMSSAVTSPWAVELLEVSYTGTPSIDTCNNVNNTTTTNRGGVDLTALTGANDLLFQIIALNGVGDTVSAISGAYTTSDLGVRFGFAAAINSAVGTAPTWTFGGNSQSSGSGLAIKEVTTGAAIVQRRR